MEGGEKSGRKSEREINSFLFFFLLGTLVCNILIEQVSCITLYFLSILNSCPV